MVIEKVSLTEIIAGARMRHASLVPESAGHLILGVMRAMAGRAVRVDSADVVLDTDGHVIVEGQARRVEADEAARWLQDLLAALLEVSQGKSSGLRAVVEETCADLEYVLAGVTRALIPINRGAAKRALARLARETLRAKARGVLTQDDIVEESSRRLPDVEAEREADEPQPDPISATAAAVASSTAVPTPLPLTPSVDIDVALDEDWDDINADIDLQTPTPHPALEQAIALEDQHDAAHAAPPAEEHVPAEPPVSAEAPEAEADSAEDVSEAPVRAEAPEVEQDPLVAEAKLAEKLMASAVALSRQRKSEPPPAFSKKPHEEGSVESLLMTFGESEEGDTVRELADSLKRMMALEPTPFPPDVDELLRTSQVFLVPELPPRRVLEVVATPAPPTPSPESVTPSAVSPSVHSVSPSVEAREASYPEESRASADPSVVVAAVIDIEPPPGDTPRISVDFAPAGRVSAISVPDLRAEEPLAEVDVSISATPPAAVVVEELVEEVVEEVVAETAACDADPVDEDVALSMSPPPAQSDDPGQEASGGLEEVTPSSIPPVVAPVRAQRRWPLFAGALLLIGGLLALAVVRHDPSWLLLPDGDQASTMAGGSCLAEIRLKGLPPRHEVLALLGTTPLTTRPLPVGVRLELVATSPGHVAERMIIPADANWVEVTEGDRQLAVDLKLEAGLDGGWPAAPGGDVGGIGPAGRVHAASSPEAELWLVVAAGSGNQAGISVPCAHTATLLVVNPDHPTAHRRVSIAPKLLEAAAQTGGAELSVQP